MAGAPFTWNSRLLDPAALSEARRGSGALLARGAAGTDRAAVRLAEHLRYRGAGTVSSSECRHLEFYFLEMNARIGGAPRREAVTAST
jgi:hypothetical protein